MTFNCVIWHLWRKTMTLTFKVMWHFFLLSSPQSHNHKKIQSAPFHFSTRLQIERKKFQLSWYLKLWILVLLFPIVFSQTAHSMSSCFVTSMSSILLSVTSVGGRCTSFAVCTMFCNFLNIVKKSHCWKLKRLYKKWHR